MAYVADINDVTQPLDSDFVGEAAPVEIRAIKQRFITLLSELESYLDAEMLVEIQRLNNDIVATTQAATDATTSTSNLLAAHTAALGNPHGITKSTIGLANIQNWEPTTAFSGAGDYYATLASLNNLKANMLTVEVGTINAAIQAVADRVAALEAKWNW